jgi:hypothetical protein
VLGLPELPSSRIEDMNADDEIGDGGGDGALGNAFRWIGICFFEMGGSIFLSHAASLIRHTGDPLP